MSAPVVTDPDRKVRASGEMKTAVLTLTLVALVGGGLLFSDLVPVAEVVAEPEVVSIAAGVQHYRRAGQFLVGNRVVDAPIVALDHNAPLVITRDQVSEADYARCSAAGVCSPTPGKVRADLPQTMVNHADAIAYAAWLSSATGHHWRLPTDAEWARAAGSKFVDDSLGIGAENGNPAARWIARYQAETAERAPADSVIRSAGWFGENEFGLRDLGGNVWEWTDSCYDTVTLAPDRVTERHVTQNCGVRIAEGQHRAYISDFIRDARGGGCGGGVPPDYLGFRLIRDDPAT